MENDDSRHQLQETGKFHLGDLVNVFRTGSLVMQQLLDIQVSVQGSVLYGTCSGTLGNMIIINRTYILFFLPFTIAIYYDNIIIK